MYLVRLLKAWQESLKLMTVLDNLEEVLITSDVGVHTTLKIIERIEERVARDKVNTAELNAILKMKWLY